MIVKPPSRPAKPVLVGLVLGDGTAIGEWGHRPVESVPAGAKLYAHRENELYTLLRAGRCDALRKGSRFAAYRIAGRRVYELRDRLAPLDAEPALAALQDWANWVRDAGGKPGSLAGSSWSIWKRTLPARITLGVRRFPVPDELPIGGRQDGRRGHYRYVALWDIRSAYQAAMRDSFVAARYKPVPLRERKAANLCGFARARVSLADSIWGPLPTRERIRRLVWPRYGAVEGVWDIQELRAAAELYGAKVEILEIWGGSSIRLPWRRWSGEMSTGRELDSHAGTLAKLTANSLWGAMASRNDGCWIRYDEQGRVVKISELVPREPACLPVAAHVSAHVRGRLLGEALSLGDDVIAVHTDSLIVPAHLRPAGPIGDEIGQWQLDAYAAELHLLFPQAYRWRARTGAGDWNYTVAGCPPEHAHKVFAGRARREAQNALVRRFLGRDESPFATERRLRDATPNPAARA